MEKLANKIRYFCLYVILTQVFLPGGVLGQGQGQAVKYLDATNANDPHRNGTQAHPFVSFEEAGMSSHTTYYLKRSVRYRLNKPVIISGKQNLRISAYGRGEDPLLYAGGLKKGIDIQNSSRIVLSNLTMEGSRDTDYLLRVIGNSSDVAVDGCSFQNAVWGIRLMGFNQRSHIEDVRIQNSEISQTGDDGIFANQVYGLLIDSCRISRVNQKWFYSGRRQHMSPGDGIQIGQSRDITISNCRIDRSDTGNKFCIIVSQSQSGKITGNRLKGPLAEGGGGASIYLGSGTDSIEVTFNDIARSPAGIYDKSRNSLIYRNIIRHNETGLWSGSQGACLVLNNTFYNNRMSIGGSRLKVKNNILYNDSLPGKMIQFGENCQSNYNCYYNPDIHEVFSLHGSLKMYQASTRQGEGSVFADPLFARASGGDLRLTQGSPCIDRGRKGSFFSSGAIACGDQVDIGAWEYCAKPNPKLSPTTPKDQQKEKHSTTIKTVSYEY